MVAERIPQPSFDAKVVFTDSDGNQREPWYLLEFEDYPELPDVFGPDLWAEFEPLVDA